MRYLFIFLAYLVGSIPFSLILGLIFVKKDVRKEGSGNVGSTNAARVLGYKIGLATLVLDVSKGFIPTYIASLYDPNLAILVGLFAILGHVFPIYLKFRGGKAVATTIGVFLAIFPKGILIALVVFLLIFMLTKYVALASMSMAISLPIIAYSLGSSLNMIYFSLFIAILIVYRHKSNIKNLLTKKEDKFI
ncbi:glycerol-3-phosphate 1-O-acyltransferase PlsY [Oceanivirga miroungae]|uniref:Glycerol-3-phosphate acyltransferase n=1 Tax=Oceanivirga miroungae TaxID=1130046 RepID=A0A6I8M7K1_9FUSO|nr:glycerol-3-phosphate 1-O-acyltransferase PlsY [Oceanivirga miroungae]VWL85437.1 Glycerol-3-phosphate acyltransferase [Oceanivirga miroungae]